MPSEEMSLPARDKVDHVAVAAEPVKASVPSAKGGHPGESRKVAKGSIQTARKSSRPASEGEKDSGFSDVSSEYQSTLEQTDSEDQPADSLHRVPKWPTRVPLPKAPGGLTVGGAFPGLTPIYIVKNVILKQPLGTSRAPQFLAWGSQHPLNGAQGSSARVLFIQPPVAPLKPLLPSRKPPTGDTYLPILSTYPRIAPHPGPGPQAKGPAAEGGPLPASGSGKNKRFCLEETWVSSSEPANPKDRGNGEEQKGGEAPAPPPPLPSGWPPSLLLGGAEPPSQNTAAPSSRRLEQAEGRMLSRASKKLSSSSLGKQRRFHNTVEILRKSGLLGITLRTKELLRQNSTTQRELSELREHAQLFCQAVQSSDGQAWAHLQQAVSRSSAYWAARGAKDSLAHLAGPPSRGAEPHGPIREDTVSKSLPGSPVNLSLAPDPSVQVAMP